MRAQVLVLALAALLWAGQSAVLGTEAGDVFYFAFGGAAGAVNIYGNCGLCRDSSSPRIRWAPA